MLDITVHTIAWNEEFLLPYFYAHYSLFAKHIVVHDNESTQPVPTHPKTTIIPYHSNGKQDNIVMRDVKNECWKNDTTEWSIVCDVDEFLELDVDLFLAQREPVAFKCLGLEMVGIDGQPLEEIARATRPYAQVKGKMDKILLFHNSITDINYTPGAHSADPDCPILGGHRLRHYNMLGEEYLVQRWQRYVPRVSDWDKFKGYGRYYFCQADEIRERHRRYLRHSGSIEPLWSYHKRLAAKLYDTQNQDGSLS